MEQEREGKKRRKPTLPSQKEAADPAVLKQRLKEKEEAAAQNRQREIERLQAKLARQEEHAKRVQERKKAMGGSGGNDNESSNDEIRLSWGGENGGLARDSAGDSADQSGGSTNDSSNASGGSSRGGSGRSTNTDTTDVGEEDNEQIKQSTKYQKKVEPAAHNVANKRAVH